jgi:Trypsin
MWRIDPERVLDLDCEAIKFYSKMSFVRVLIPQAAHCIVDEVPESYLVEYATTVISNGLNGERIAHVEKLIWHEKYSDEEINDDIGLVKVKTPLQIDFSDFKVRLPMRGAYFATGSPAVLSGE